MTPVVERARALHADGVAATASGRPTLAARRLRTALQLLPDGTGELRGRVLVSLAHAEAEQGRIDVGLGLLNEAEPLLRPERRGVLFGQRGLLLLRTGRRGAALRDLDAAVGLLGHGAEQAELARALLNRGVLHLATADVRQSRADLTRCAQLAAQHGLARVAAKAAHNLGYLDYLAGDLPAALRAFDVAAREYTALAPTFLPVLAVDRARALLAAGLFREADRELEAALVRFGRQRLSQDYAEAQLARAESALLAGRPEPARRWAMLARVRFLRRDNETWAALATLVVLRAELAARTNPVATARRARRLAAALTALGLDEDARLAGLVAVRSLVAAGRDASATEVLTSLPAPRRTDRLDTRLLRRLTQAELAISAGRGADAARQLRAGLTELQRHRSQLGCLDLQTGAAVHGQDLARVGLAAALAGGSPGAVFGWSERARAQAMLLPPVRPPDDPDAAAALEELRHARHALRQAELAHRPTGPVRARCEALQRTIREHSWFAAGPGTTATLTTLGAVRTELGGAAMAVYLRDGDALHVLVVAGGSATLVPLGRYSDAEEAVRRLRADLDAVAGRALPERMHAAAMAATRRDAATLSALTVAPILDLIGDRDLIVIPTGALAAVPWRMLEGCADRPVTVAPSATVWHAARSRRRASTAAPAGGALLVAGPGNAQGEAEIRAIAALRPGATVLAGAAATPAATLRGLDGADLAHLAAHGHHEPENALFSSLDLAGGPLMGYDVQHLARPPATVVLSTCDLGLTDVRPGDEALGMATALIGAGSATVIASVSRVSDSTAIAVMTGYHRASDGSSPATALAQAGAAEELSSFVCFGSG